MAWPTAIAAEERYLSKIADDVRGMINLKDKSGRKKLVIVKNDDFIQVLEYGIE